MNTTSTMDSGDAYIDDKPGAKLALLRNKKGHTTEFVAGKLHLRVHLIELLEADDYEKLPEPVFIKGYLRAYAKLLEVSPDEFIATYNRCYSQERKVERALWQGRKQTHKAENTIRWVTSFFAVAVVMAVVMWWSKNKEAQVSIPTAVSQANVKLSVPESEIRLTDLSKMRSLLSSVNEIASTDSASE